MNNTSAARQASWIKIAPGHAMSVQVAVGTGIQTLNGKVWVTQEDDVHDHVVPAGVTFFADRAGQMVLSAVDGGSTVVVRPAARGDVPGTVRIDSFERLARDARYAHAVYIGDLLATAVEKLVTGARRLVDLAKQRMHPVRRERPDHRLPVAGVGCLHPRGTLRDVR
jgi:hypothetical protein